MSRVTATQPGPGDGLARWLFSTPLYRLTLGGGAPKHLTRLPPARPPGDPVRGHAVVAGQLICAGQVFSSTVPRWRDPAAREEALAALHSFEWLDDLAAVGSTDAHRRARELIAGWLRDADGWDPVAWAPRVLARRLTAWLVHARFIASAMDEDPLSVPLLRSAARQTRHLARIAAWAPAGVDRLVAASALIVAGLCGLAGDGVVRRGMKLLAREITIQVWPDGGHVTRSPDTQARSVAVLTDTLAMLRQAGWPVPDALPVQVGQMATILRMLRHGDGGLALFNGTGMLRPTWIEAVLQAAGGEDPVTSHAPETGFARLSAGDAVVIADVGAPPASPFDHASHAGALSFELSCGRDRLIVNCGARAESEWIEAARASAAHSTLTVDDTNSYEILPHSVLGRRPAAVVASLESSDGNHWLTASHDGYAANFGLRHTRRLYLAASGRDLRGEDTVTGPYRGSFAIRFHLHPAIRASLLQNSAAVLLRTPGGAAWRLQTGSGTLTLAESIYLAVDGAPRRAEQIVISGRLDGDETVVKWALRRIDP